MERTVRERIRFIKQTVKKHELATKDVVDLCDKNGSYFHPKTINKVLGEGSEDLNYQYNTIIGVYEALYNAYGDDEIPDDVVELIRSNVKQQKSDALIIGDAFVYFKNYCTLICILEVVCSLCDVREGVVDNRVKKHDKRKLDKKGKTTRKGAVAFVSLKLHDLFLLLLHGLLVVSTFIFSLDNLDFGSELGHCYLVFLLFDREG